MGESDGLGNGQSETVTNEEQGQGMCSQEGLPPGWVRVMAPPHGDEYDCRYGVIRADTVTAITLNAKDAHGEWYSLMQHGTEQTYVNGHPDELLALVKEVLDERMGTSKTAAEKADLKALEEDRKKLVDGHNKLVVQYRSLRQDRDRWKQAFYDYRSGVRDGSACDGSARAKPDGPTPAEALYAFTAWLTGREEILHIGANEDCSAACEAVDYFCKANGWETPDRMWQQDCGVIYPVEASTDGTVTLGGKPVSYPGGHF